VFGVVKWYLYGLSIFGFFLFDFCNLFSVCFVVGWVMGGVGIMFFICLGMKCNFV
jgi:hypothetical protein